MRGMQEGPGLAYQRIYAGVDPDSFDGAQRVADTIRAYWAKQGHSVQVTVERAKQRSSAEHTLWLIRSDSFNGYPRSLPLPLNHPAVRA